MKILVTRPDDEDLIYDVLDKHIIIGSGKSCHLTIESDVIAPKQLEVYTDNSKVIIKNISKSNNLTYNGREFPKGASLNHENGGEILVAGKINICIFSDESYDLDKSIIFEKTRTITKKMFEEKEPKTRMIVLEKNVSSDTVVALGEKTQTKLTKRQRKIESYEPKEVKKKKKSSIPAVIGILVLLTGSYFYIFSGSEEDSPKDAIAKEKKNISKIKKQKKTQKSLGQINFEKTITKEKCKGKSLTALCKYLLGDMASHEGLRKVDKELIFYLNFDKRLITFLGKKLNNLDQASKMAKTPSILAMSVLGNHKILRKLDEKGYFKVRAHFFRVTKNTVKYDSTFSLDTSFYRRFTKDRLELALKKFRNTLDTDLFERNLEKLLVKE